VFDVLERRSPTRLDADVKSEPPHVGCYGGTNRRFSAALSGLGILLEWFAQGGTAFALGYHLSGFQPFNSCEFV
jgi:hypothetical protein